MVISVSKFQTVPQIGGDGSLGDLTVSSDTQFTGEKNYNNVTIQTAKNLGPNPGEQLYLRVKGNLTVEGTGALNADGMGYLGGEGNGGQWGYRVQAPNVAVPEEVKVVPLTCPAEGEVESALIPLGKRVPPPNSAD